MGFSLYFHFFISQLFQTHGLDPEGLLMVKELLGRRGTLGVDGRRADTGWVQLFVGNPESLDLVTRVEELRFLENLVPPLVVVRT